MAHRTAEITRSTNETNIFVAIDLDGQGLSTLETGLPFLEHMMEQVAKHGCLNLTIRATGDLEIDAHHTVEDIGITLGQAVDKALGTKTAINRYGHSYVPLDESLSRVVLDLSGRPRLNYQVNFPRAQVGAFDVDLFAEFFQGFVNHSRCTLHVDCLKGDNAHHIIETVFKAFARALRMAVEIDPRMKNQLPSTKGTL